jgi:hypothetical protein
MAKAKIDMDYCMAVVEGDNDEGCCLACGNWQTGVEPDARNYTCEACGAAKVFGAEQILLEGL